MPDITIGRLKGQFVVSWWENGKRKRYRLEARDPKAAEAEGIDVYRRETVKQAEHSIEALWSAYRDEKAGRRIADIMKSEWLSVGPFFGAFRPDQITVDMCRNYTAQRRKKGIKDGTIHTELGHLRTVFIWAQKRGLIDRAPHVERPSKPAPKDRWLTRAEITRLLDTPMPLHIRLAILMMLSTACRVGAALELTWDRVDFEREQIDLRLDALGPRKGRVIVPMNAGLKAALSHARKAALTDHVIEWAGSPVKSIKTAFYAVVKEAGLEGVSPHVLRHTAAVHLAERGTPMHKIAQYLGHSDSRITERVYARFAPDHMRDEAEALDFTKPAREVSQVQ